MLALLFGQAQRSFYGNEIISLAGSGSGAVQRELARLESSGLVTVRRVGNQKHYQANADAPIFPELRSLILKTFGVADVLHDALQSLWPDVQIAFVYGSMAKGTEHAASDVDLMVVGTLPSHTALLEALLPAQGQLGRIINPTYYTTDEFAQRISDGAAFMSRVLAQPKIFVKGSEHDISSLGSAGESGADRKTEGGTA
ncbi:nucleotidyltransferase domain-containing protein [Actimicrobium sp. CCI2.3]|uniref:nucleotidyltransferase domain-containing protein n=1 Tax=Actimicrobium sp. CCI2.3 TaxID=3048616 RepID=UPI002AB3EB08|nr:nucleotidyltransferase domain-containing protein [Actimicrobium sp. CCI2.3]MDY7575996.1 nucleotidyltransferase domain-containing protein [Actimicrobium sp. CCI2.3]MEB0023309.1 nucleotidyltransferase domain-containing protein [Actimicrobium sp. CCI2.3]